MQNKQFEPTSAASNGPRGIEPENGSVRLCDLAHKKKLLGMNIPRVQLFQGVKTRHSKAPMV